ncbi:hypothetical protein [Streptomyces sp. NL15-2K]|uniref:hypothetical protein n=1 Tax=Streptomyces sp. NL15-2K TaxID=376149 RepID=UPI000FF9DDA8|nr:MULTISPECIES: hypothetical protein [Actinomycetes]WKX11110.1 hypothetical protein Q4V64_27800 [Kutzneria buriramensis]GCB47465.1 hypothetical protein SNL152K_4770 [Streptomyces sp. NL15-2K]
MGQVGCVPGKSAVVGFVVENDQTVVCRCSGDDEAPAAVRGRVTWYDDRRRSRA